MVLSVDDVGFTAEQLVGLSESRRALLQELTAYGLTLAEGRTAEVVAPLLDVAVADRLHLRLEAERLLAERGIGDDALRARYLAAPEYELTVRHLIVMSARYESDAQRTAARDKATRALERIRAGEPFPDVAAEVSEEPGAEGRQGLLTPGREGAWVDEFWSAASALEIGGISDVVETQYGFHVLRLEGREVVAFDEARPEVVLATARAAGLRNETHADAPRPENATFSPDARTTTDPGAVLAEWDAGRVTWSDVRRRAAAEGGATWDRLRAGDATTRSAMFDLALAEQAVRGRAEAAGIAPGAAWLEGRTRDLVEGFEREGALLGMVPGMPRSTVADAALAALGASGQNAQLARDRVHGWRGLLDRVYDYSQPNSEETPPAGQP